MISGRTQRCGNSRMPTERWASTSVIVAGQRWAVMEAVPRLVRHSSVTFMERTIAQRVIAYTAWFPICGMANTVMEGGQLALKKAPTWVLIASSQSQTYDLRVSSTQG